MVPYFEILHMFEKPSCILLGSRQHPTKKNLWTMTIFALCFNFLESSQILHCIFISPFMVPDLPSYKDYNINTF